MKKDELKEKVRDELRRYAIVAGYLYVCFAVLLLYEAALLQQLGQSDALPHGVAVIKALVLGKFLLIGDAVGLGRSAAGSSLAGRVATRSLLLLLLLVALTGLEELIVGAVHGRPLADTVAGLGEHSGLELLAKSLIMLLVLIPLVAGEQLQREGRLR